VGEPGVHVTVPHGRNLRPAGFVVVHQARRLDREWLAGLPTTPAARTVVDVAAATRSRDDVRALVSDAVQRRIVTVAELVTATACAARHGSRLLRDGWRPSSRVRAPPAKRCSGICCAGRACPSRR